MDALVLYNTILYYVIIRFILSIYVQLTYSFPSLLLALPPLGRATAWSALLK